LRARALRLLTRREHSAHEVERRLLAAGGDPDAVRTLVVELQAAGYLSDRRFAESTVRQKQGRFSRRHIAETLRSKGVTGEVAQDALAGLAADDYAAARALWQRRFGEAPADPREKARQLRFLVARGFTPGVVLRLWREHGASVDDSGEPAGSTFSDHPGDPDASE
jgi:regulatory protein